MLGRWVPNATRATGCTGLRIVTHLTASRIAADHALDWHNCPCLRGNEMRNSSLMAAAYAAMLVSGCSTRPRNFAANLSAPVADRAVFENDYRTCQTLVRGGHRSGFRSAASTIAVGAGAISGGIAVGAVGAGVGASTAGVGTGWSSVGAGLGAAAAAATVFVAAAGFGVTRLIRGGRERKYKRAMSDCLSEYGYGVGSWEKLPKRDDAAQIAAQRATLALPASPQAATVR